MGLSLNRLVNTRNLSHDEWLKFRRQGIGGSDAAAICGLNPYSSAIDVYMDKLELVDGMKDSEAMRIGRDLEEYVAKRFCEATGKKVRKANAIFYHTDAPYMLANVDRLVVGENAGLECKTCSAYSAEKWQDNKIPINYEIQCHHYMAVTGAEKWYIACVILGVGFVWQVIERDEELIRDLQTLEKAFWLENVIGKKMPAPDGSEATDNLIKERYADAEEGKAILLPDGFTEKLQRRDELNKLIEKMENEKKTIEQEIKIVMEDAETSCVGDYQVSWKNVNSNRVDSTLLKKQFPDVYKKCIKESKTRKFIVKEKK